MGGLSWEKILVDGHRAKSSNYIGSAGRCWRDNKSALFFWKQIHRRIWEGCYYSFGKVAIITQFVKQTKWN